MSKYGLGKGLNALIPNQKPPEEDEFVSEDNNSSNVENSDSQGYGSEVSQVDHVDEINTDAHVEEDGNEIANISVDKIIPNPYQPRKVFDPAALHELSESIQRHGIIQPLVVTRKEDGNFELVAGERRLQAAKLSGLKKVPAIIRNKELAGFDKLELAIIENLQREDLNLIEQARAFKRLHDEFGFTYEEIADKVGKSRPAVSNIVRLLKLPVEIQRALIDGKIAEGHARAILQVAEREGQFSLYEMIQKKNLSTEQAMSVAREWTARPELRKTNQVKVRETKALENHLKNKLGVKSISIKRNENGGGRINITCLTEEEFHSFVEKLNSTD